MIEFDGSWFFSVAVVPSSSSYTLYGVITSTGYSIRQSRFLNCNNQANAKLVRSIRFTSLIFFPESITFNERKNENIERQEGGKDEYEERANVKDGRFGIIRLLKCHRVDLK